MQQAKIIGLRTLKNLNYSELASAYQTIYGAEPWSERWKCPDCGQKYGVELADSLDDARHRHCQSACATPLADFWPTEGLLTMFDNLSEKELFVTSLAFDGTKIVGFCWGYQVAHDEVDSLLKLDGVARQLFQRDAPTPLVYLADIAVNADYRGQGLAKRLFEQYMVDSKKFGAKAILSRTLGGENPSHTNQWFKRMGMGDILHYPGEDYREVHFARISEMEY